MLPKTPLHILFLLASATAISQPLTDNPGSDYLLHQEKVYLHIDKPFYFTGETLWFKAYCLDASFFTLSSHSKVLYVELLDSQGNPAVQEKAELRAGIGSGQFLINRSLASGRYYLRAYTAWMKNFRQDLFFSATVTVINPFVPLAQRQPGGTASVQGADLVDKSGQIDTSGLQLSLDSHRYGPRQQVQLRLDGDPGREESWELSVSVHKIHPDLGPNLVGLPQSLLCSTAYSDNGAEEQTGQPDEITHLPELYGHIINGVAQGNDLEGQVLTLIIPGTNPVWYTGRIDENREFRIQVPLDIQASTALFYLKDSQLDEVEIYPDYLPMRNPHPTPALRLDESHRLLIEEYSAHVQISTAYLKQTKVQGVEKPGGSREFAFYGQPEYRYNLDDYTRFPTMEEVFLEYIRYAPFKRIDGARNLYVTNFYSSLYNYSNSIEFEKPATTMIDGVPVNDLEFIMAFDPLKVERVDLVTRRFNAGLLRLPGIISIVTYKGDFGGQELPSTLIGTSFQGLQKPKEFFQVNYQSDPGSRTPDYRKVLLWNPNVNIERGQSQTVDFYTSDDTGRYRVEINGVSNQGRTIYLPAEFEVISEDAE